MTDLLSRLQEAEGGSRELDGDIAELVQPEGLRKQQAACLNTLKRAQRRKGYTEPDLGEWYRTNPTSESWKAPPYTTSADAALQLMPEGKWWVLNSGVQTGQALALVGGSKGWGDKAEANASTPALALCAACIKAMEAENEVAV